MTARPEAERKGPKPRGAARLAEWLASFQGTTIAESECRIARELLANLFGYHIVQVGLPTALTLLEDTRIAHRVLVSTETDPCAGVSLLARADGLPIAPSSVDVMLLPHLLEFSANPHGILREAERVLIAEGHLLIFGFNPWSTFGFWRRAAGWRGFAPWSGRFLSLARVSDWLSLLGFDIERIARISYRPPLASARWHQRLEFMERLGAHFWPLFSNVYCVLARKRVATVTPIRANWATRRRLAAGGVAEPTGRSAGHCP
jgi:SAM-dependent methyltransferase